MKNQRVKFLTAEQYMTAFRKNVFSVGYLYAASSNLQRLACFELGFEKNG